VDPQDTHAPSAIRLPFIEGLGRGLRMRCPCCGIGSIYRRPYRMFHDCPVCRLDYFREPGYYVGAMIVNYLATAFLILGAYLISRALPEIWHAAPQTKIPVWMACAVVISLALVPLARSMWLALDYWIEPWQPNDALLRTDSSDL
jgi:uncharacterized protein (DUF983 family)